MISTQYIKLNMTPGGVLPILHCSQYDIGRPLGVIVYNGSETVDLSQYTATIEATRTDGAAIVATVTTNENEGTFATTATMTNEADKYFAQLVLVQSGKRVASLPFVMCIVPAAMDENSEAIQEDASLFAQFSTSMQSSLAALTTEAAVNSARIDNMIALQTAGSMQGSKITTFVAQSAAQYSSSLDWQSFSFCDYTTHYNTTPSMSVLDGLSNPVLLSAGAYILDSQSASITDECVYVNLTDDVRFHNHGYLGSAPDKRAVVIAVPKVTDAAGDISGMWLLFTFSVVSDVPVDLSEITDARVGADGVTYNTLGDAIRGQVGDLKSALDTFAPNSNACINGLPAFTERNLARYYYKSTSTTPNQIMSTPASNGIGSIKLEIDTMPDYVAYNTSDISGVTGVYPVFFGNGTNGTDFVYEITNLTTLGTRPYIITLDTNLVLICKEMLVNAFPTATHIYINYNATSGWVKNVVYYHATSVADRLDSIEQDGWVTPNRTSFLVHNKNYYNPSQVVSGYYVSTAGEVKSDSRFSYIAIEVPSGKTVFTSATINGVRAIANSARFMCAKNRNGAVIGSGDTMNTAVKYTNDTNDIVTVYFSLWYAHPTYTATDYMIQIVDSDDDVVLSDYVPYGYTFGDVIQIDLDPIKELEDIVTLPKDYFKTEIETTAETIRTLTIKPCLTYNIITDTHLRPSSADSVRQTFDSIANITALNRISFADAVVHLGDTVAQSMYTVDGATNDEIFATMRMYVKKFNDINRCALIANGNHDGKQANIYQQYEWYSITGRLNEAYTEKDRNGTNYFYIDYPRIKTRCVFLATPDNIDDNASAFYGYTPRMLSWLVSEALDTPDDYGVLMFAHIPPFFTWYIPNGMSNRADFYGVCNAFHNHTSYSGTVQNADFTGKSGTKIVAYICGHAHGDAVLSAGETVSGVDENGNAVTTTNEMPCPVINIGCGLFSTGAMSNYGAVAPARADKTVTQDLWDTMIYRPDLNKIYMIRFGAGNDREISVN